MADFGKRVLVPFPDLVDEMVELLRPHAEALECVAEIEHARVMARRGTSADHQLRVYKRGAGGGRERPRRAGGGGGLADRAVGDAGRAGRGVSRAAQGVRTDRISQLN